MRPRAAAKAARIEERWSAKVAAATTSAERLAVAYDRARASFVRRSPDLLDGLAEVINRYREQHAE